MLTESRLKREHQDLLRYIAKCVVGCVIMFTIGHILQGMNVRIDVSWVLISMVLVLSPDGKEAIPLTVVRIKANLMASAVALALLYLSPSQMLAITIAVTITILCCYWFNLMLGSRPALAAVIIIAMHPQGEYLWSTAVERVISVFVGCVLALVLTFMFHRGLTLGHLLRGDKLFE